jgi:hypothetical protein
VTTTLDAHADIDVGETLSSEKKNWLHHLSAESLRLKVLGWATVNLEQTATGLAVGNSNSVTLRERRQRRKEEKDRRRKIEKRQRRNLVSMILVWDIQVLHKTSVDFRR